MEMAYARVSVLKLAGARGQSQMLLLRVLSTLLFLRQVLSVHRGWLAMELQGCTHLRIPSSTEITGVYHHARLLKYIFWNHSWIIVFG